MHNLTQSYEKKSTFANLLEEKCARQCILVQKLRIIFLQISLGLTCFQFAFALLLPSSHILLGLCGRNCLRSQIEQINQRISFSQKLSTITQNSSATVGDGKVMLM